MRKPEEKYLNDASYYTLVNLLVCLIDTYGFTRRELVEAVNLAVTRCEKYYRAKESQQETPPRVGDASWARDEPVVDSLGSSRWPIRID
jgi:hypothetical protein